MNLPGLLSELQRRRVFRVAAAYAVAAWLVIQIAATTFPHLSLPGWAVTLVIVLAALGFPVALVLAWAFDITPEGVVRTDSSSASPPPRWTGSRAWGAQRLAALAGALILAGIGMAFVFLRSGSELERNRVVVAIFENQTGEPGFDPVGRMAADWIARGLTRTGLLEVVSPGSAFAASEHAAGSIHHIAQETGAGLVVTGAYYLDGPLLRMQAQVTDARSGRLLQAVEPVAVPTDSAAAGVEVLRARVAGVVALLYDPLYDTDWISVASQPPSFETYREYTDGITAYLRGDFPGAARSFHAAIALDSTFLQPQLWLAATLLALDGRAEADSLTRVLSASREAWPPFDRAFLDYVRASIDGTRVERLRRARQLAATGGSQWRFVKASEASYANLPHEAVQALRRIDPERGFMRDFLGYWMVLSEAQHVLGEHRRELRDARRARVQHPDLLRPVGLEARALAALGRVAELERLMDEIGLFPPDEQGATPGGVMREVAGELRAHGHPRAAAALLDRSIAWYEAHPGLDRDPRLKAVYARSLYEAGRLEEARAILEALLRHDPQNLPLLGTLGPLAARQGNSAEARRISTAIAEVPRPYPTPNAAAWRARIAAQLGETDEALSLLREAFADGLAYGIWIHTDIDLDPLRELPAFQNLTRPRR